MSVHGSVTLTWGDGEHVFNISKIGHTLELQDKCGGVGIGTIDFRLRTGQFFVNDFRETIRIGLIGGGKAPDEATKLVKRYVDERPWKESVLTATAIIMAAMVGIPAENVGKKKPDDQPDQETQTTMAESSDQPSMASVAPSDLPPGKSTTLPDGNSQPVSTVTI